jgi:hypothetical protein
MTCELEQLAEFILQQWKDKKASVVWDSDGMWEEKLSLRVKLPKCWFSRKVEVSRRRYVHSSNFDYYFKLSHYGVTINTKHAKIVYDEECLKRRQRKAAERDKKDQFKLDRACKDFGLEV